MKIYLIFVGSFYYPQGGMEDFQQDFDTVEQSRDWLERLLVSNPATVKPNLRDDLWCQIYDIEGKRQVYVGASSVLTQHELQEGGVRVWDELKETIWEDRYISEPAKPEIPDSNFEWEFDRVNKELKFIRGL